MKQSRNNKNRKRRRSAVGDAARIARSRISYFFKERSATVVGGSYQLGVTVSAVVKHVVYAIAGLLLILLQISFFPKIRPFGAAPDVLIVAVFAVAMFENERVGAVFGLAVGFVVEAAGGIGVSLLPLVYMLVGYICGVVATEYYKRSFVLFLIFDASILLVRMFTTLMYIVFTWSVVDLSVVLPKVLIPEALSTLVISPFPAILIYLISRIFRKEEAPKPGLD